MFVFDNVLTAGTVLVREQIESQNWTPSAGASGWVIKANGDASFRDIDIRGAFSTGPPTPYIDIPADSNNIYFHPNQVISPITNPGFIGSTQDAVLYIQSPTTVANPDTLQAAFSSGSLSGPAPYDYPQLSLLSATLSAARVYGAIEVVAGVYAGGMVRLNSNQVRAENGNGVPSELYLNYSGGCTICGLGGTVTIGGTTNANTINCGIVNGSVFNTSGGSALGNALIVAGGQMNASVSPPTGAGPGAGTAWWNLTGGTNYRLSRTTSSRRYKENIRTLDGYTEEQILSLIPRWYQRNDERDYTQDDEPLIPVTDATPWVPGFIAEEATELGLVSWVSQDSEGRPDSFSYGEFAAVAHQYVLRAQAKKITELEARLERLERLINDRVEASPLPSDS